MLENLLRMFGDVQGVNPFGRQFALDYVKEQYGDDARYYLDSIMTCSDGRFSIFQVEFHLDTIIQEIEKADELEKTS